MLLDPAAPVPDANDQVNAASGAELLDLLALRLARLLEAHAARGLRRAFAEQVREGPFLQGRLDVGARLRDPAGLKHRLRCISEDFTADVPANQVPRAVAEGVLGLHFLGDPARVALRRSLAAYAEISPIAMSRETLAAAYGSSGVEPSGDHRRLLDLCRLLVEGLTPGEEAGAVAFPTFLLNMERVFERYVTETVTAACAEDHRLTVSVQPLQCLHRSVLHQPDIPIRPDAVISRARGPWRVVDAKWKDVTGAAPQPADVYQVLAYAAALGARHAALIYPGRRHRAWTYQMARSPLRLEVHTLRVVGSPAVCARSRERFGAALRSARDGHA
jgi:5-methylcytosine-specific restriction enzyme subunit McrC